MNRINWSRASHVCFEATRRTAARSALALGLIYLAFAISYLVQPGSPGAMTLLGVTGVSAVLLLGLAAWSWNREISALECHIWIFGICLIVLVNINAGLWMSGNYLFSISHLFCQLAAAVLAPTPITLAVFVVVNILSCIGVVLVADIPAVWGLATLGFVMTTGVAVFIFVARFRNISMLESLRQAVEEGRDRDFREIIEKNPDAVVLVRDGVIAYASAPLASILKLESVEDVLGSRLETIVADGRDLLDELLEGELRGPSSVLTLCRRDGEHVLVDVAEPKIIDFEDAPAVMLVLRDVTKSREALEARLLLADRMSAAGTLAAGVAHEINNPLAYVSMNLVALKNELAKATIDREATAELLAEVSDGVGRVADIVRDIDAVSTIKENDDHSTDPTAALRTAVRMAGNQLRHQTKLECDLTALPKVIGNDGKLVQLFLNVLINAAHAIDDDSGEDNFIAVTTQKIGDSAVIEVSDTGAGMSEETRTRIFDPFFTTKPPGSGTGLGMFFCHTVATAMGGEIDVDSKLGSGTTITIRLPAASSTTGKFRPVPSTPTPMAKSGDELSVLVVDDEPFVGKAIARVLAAYNVTVTNSGEEAISLFRQDRHDLILCDIMMPGLSGPQVYERLRELDPDILNRVMFMTGGAFTPKAREFASAFSNRVLKKPVAVDDLLNLANDVAAKKSAPQGSTLHSDSNRAK